jgi:hypothetical protein
MTGTSSTTRAQGSSVRRATGDLATEEARALIALTPLRCIMVS